MVKRTFVCRAAILFGANLLNRILGFIYRISIMVHVGGEAYGLFAQVFPIYMMALVLTTAGIPCGIKLVSEEVTWAIPAGGPFSVGYWHTLCLGP